MLLKIISRLNYALKSSPLFPELITVRPKSRHLDYSRYPKLNEDEIEETFVRGSGPGGQAVNKTSNCVVLRHLPTNIVIKCHMHRIASRNREEARRLLLEKLDSLMNGEHSISVQLKAIQNKKTAERKRRQEKILEMKKSWRARESEASKSNETLEPNKYE